MNYLIKLIFFLLISLNIFASENKINEILFKLNNKAYSYVDLEKRTEYVALINNYNSSEFTKAENNEIIDDYISSLIFYEYYILNKLTFENLENEIEIVIKKNINKIENLNKEEIKNFQFNTKIDLIRNKIIERNLNSRRESLLQDVEKLDLLYNYNLQYIIIKENLLDIELIENIYDRKNFNDLKKNLKKNKINFFYKEEDINDNNIISKKIKKIINQNLKIYISKENGYISIISINKNLESYEGIFVKLINFKSNIPFEKKDLECNNLNKTIDTNKTIFKQYEYSKLNNNIKNNLKSINDYILFKENNEYNYIVLCDLNYDEKILKNINFNKNVNSLVKKIQKNFIKKYKNEYNFIRIK